MAPVGAQSKTTESTAPSLDARRALVLDTASFAHATYSACVDEAKALQRAIGSFLDEPSASNLGAAREAWLRARRVYGESECLRFSEGPIDDRRVGVETYINAWPVDESYIDGTVDAPDSGIVHDTTKFPNLSGTILTFANERGGEANVSIGWHAIEFLLWGQDLYEDGPGRRSHTDYVVGTDEGVVRRRRYLSIVSALLVEHLTKVRDAWDPKGEDNYRTKFLKLPTDEAVRRVLKGVLVLSGFELSGERMAVAYETQSQEDEHSCFSDSTSDDLRANQRGIAQLVKGTGRGMKSGGIAAIAKSIDPKLEKDLASLVELSTKALKELPDPFDQVLIAAENSPARKKFLTAIEALESQAEALAVLGLELGFEIPMTPGK